MDYGTIEVDEMAGGVGIITLNRPEKRNAISIDMRVEISTCLGELEQNSSVSVIIFTGSGSAFSAGFDMEEFDQPERHDELFKSSSRYHRHLWNYRKILIAAVNGPAMGGGFDLATLCDVRICSDTATFGHPEIKFGAPPLFTPLRWIIGDGLARDLCLTGRKIDGKEAHRIGLVSEIVTEGRLMDRAISLGRDIGVSPLETLTFTKGYFISNAGRDFEESFLLEHDRAFREIILKRAVKGFKNEG